MTSYKLRLHCGNTDRKEANKQKKLQSCDDISSIDTFYLQFYAYLRDCSELHTSLNSISNVSSKKRVPQTETFQFNLLITH